VLIAILEKRTGLNLSTYDVYLNVAGGFKVNENAVDLAVCLAIASSLKDKPVPKNVVAFGECGLSGEIRRVPHTDRRIKEAQKLGYNKVISPESAKSIRDVLGVLNAKR
jgi:DNA repair protein RadA/Sms